MRTFRAHAEALFLRDAWRLHIWRPAGDQIETLHDNGTWVLQDPAVSDPHEGLLLPRDAWAAICDFAAPHADAGEVKELRESLALERARVEKLIDSTLRGIS